MAEPSADERMQKRREHLLELRAAVFEEMEAADARLSRLRMRVERLESDIRLGAEPEEEYERSKGHEMPETEARLVQLFHELLKLEDKIRETR